MDKEVWAPSTHLGTKRTVAVKVIQPQLSAHHQFVARFQREAEAAGRLRHPNVVDITDFGFAQTTNGPVAYLVMEYLDGCTLAEIVAEEGALPIQWVIDILEQVCAGLRVIRPLKELAFSTASMLSLTRLKSFLSRTVFKSRAKLSLNAVFTECFPGHRKLRCA